MNTSELIAKQQNEIEELKQEIGYIKDNIKDALNQLTYCEQWNLKCEKFPTVAMRAVVLARQALED